jgi:hypothetical protein
MRELEPALEEVEAAVLRPDNARWTTGADNAVLDAAQRGAEIIPAMEQKRSGAKVTAAEG